MLVILSSCAACYLSYMKISVEEIHLHFPMLEANLISEIAHNAEMKHYQKGEFILRKGAYIRAVYLVLDGLVKVVRENGSGSQFFMHYLKGGEACAMSMILPTGSI